MEELRLAGAGMVLVSSGWMGLHAAVRLRRVHDRLRDLSAALGRMAGEVGYGGTPFRPLCQRAAEGCGGPTAAFFRQLAHGAAGTLPVGPGMTRAAARGAGLELPEAGLRTLERLFDRFGLGDRETQLDQFRLAREELDRQAEAMERKLGQQCRSDVLLGLCAGAAVLVLVL